MYYIYIYTHTYIHNYNMFADSPSNNNDTQLLQDRKPPIWRVLSDRLSQISTKVAVKPVFSSCDLYSWKERIVAEWQGTCFLSPKPRRIKSLNNFGCLFIFADLGNDVGPLWACFVGLSILLQWIRQRRKAKPSCTSCVWPQAFRAFFREGPFDFGKELVGAGRR